MTYSQGREEEIILKFIGSRKEGSVFDIGAFDGKTNSNSLALIERGWTAVLVEPSPSCFLKLLACHEGNPKVHLLNAAVGVEGGIRRFYEFENDQCGSTLEKNAAVWKSEERKCREYFLPQVTVSQIVAQLGGGADVLSVDTEGTSYEVMASCPIKSWSPKVIIVEHDNRIIELSGWASENKYSVIGLNAENILLGKD